MTNVVNMKFDFSYIFGQTSFEDRYISYNSNYPDSVINVSSEAEIVDFEYISPYHAGVSDLDTMYDLILTSIKRNRRFVSNLLHKRQKLHKAHIFMDAIATYIHDIATTRGFDGDSGLHELYHLCVLYYDLMFVSDNMDIDKIYNMLSVVDILRLGSDLKDIISKMGYFIKRHHQYSTLDGLIKML